MMPSRSNHFLSTLLLLGGLSVPSLSAATTATATTAPVGVVTIQAEGVSSGAFAVPLESAPVYVGVVSGASKRTLAVKGANWSARPRGSFAADPLIVRMTSGRAAGRTYSLLARQTNQLRLDTSEDLTAIVSPGDAFDILPADTLASLFGVNGAGLTTNANPDLADNVQLLEDGAWKTYFPDGKHWRRVGDEPKVSHDGAVIAPGEGFVFVRRKVSPYALQVTGALPANPEFSAPARVPAALVGNPFATDRRLDSLVDALGLERGRGWDSVAVRNGNGWQRYFPVGKGWKDARGRVTRLGPLVADGTAVLVERDAPAAKP